MNRQAARPLAAYFAALVAALAAALLAGCATPVPTTSGGVPIGDSETTAPFRAICICRR